MPAGDVLVLFTRGAAAGAGVPRVLAAMLSVSLHAGSVFLAAARRVVGRAAEISRLERAVARWYAAGLLFLLLTAAFFAVLGG